MKKIVSVFLILLALSGCGTNPAQSSADSTAASQATGTEAQSGEDAKALYQDKTIIYFAMPDGDCERARARFRYVNELLVEMDSAYILEAVPIKVELDFQTLTSNYSVNLETAITGGQAIDLLATDPQSNAVSPYPYGGLVEKGLLEPMKPWLKGEGKSLYEAYPENLWDTLTYKGNIYSLNFSLNWLNSAHLYVSESLMGKHGLKLSTFEGKRLDELPALFDTVGEKEGRDSFNLLSILGMNYYVNFQAGANSCISSAVALSYDQGAAEFILDDQDYINALKAISQIGASGNLCSTDALSNVSSDDVFAMLTSANEYDDWASSCLNDKNGDLYPFIDAKIKSVSYYRNTFTGTGISALSQNKEGAFWILTQINTVPELANALYYGQEGQDYEINNGKASTEAGWFELSYGNAILSMPSAIDKADKAEIMQDILSTAEPTPFPGFFFDATPVSEQIAATDGIIAELDKLMTPDNESERVSDFDAFIADIRARCEAAGVYDIVDEVNRQLEAWRQENGHE